ncbi:distal membrane-arm assembly complex protein 2 [Halyomorpha halys]|uniref:distal membrane-arm assembly complex protein 2 n=1 Tax=Halyomorpha halys TaxID=286706 RepID=UPI0006D52094|nr:distal membrane-arm assembly complex protein 2 [Halyomorpha halys]
MLVRQFRFHVIKGRELGIISGITWSRLSSNSAKDLSEPPRHLKIEDYEYPLNRYFKAFGPKKNRVPNLSRYNPLTISQQQIDEIKDNAKRKFEIFKQRYIEERHNILGFDLAAAHFIVYRGGKVKFRNEENWIEMKEDEKVCNDLVTTYDPNLFLECIDLSNTKIRYEGLVNLSNLRKLKWLSLRNCQHVDDWFLDKISGEYAETLEYLDISDCFNVTDNGLNGFYRFQNLKKLLVHNIVRNISFEFRCFLLEDTIPGLTIEGVKYLDVK